MRGVAFAGNKAVEVREFPDPVPGPGDALVRIRASGLCGSDLHRYRAGDSSPVVTGHEPCGQVAALGPNTSGPPVGQRVVVYHYSGCGVCEHCRVGWEQLCVTGNHKVYGGGGHDGGNAEYMVVPARTLVPLPDELTFEEGAALACGTGTAYGALVRLNVSGRDTLAVFGQGPVGASATLLAGAMGARVIAVDVSPARLDFARELGAEHVVDGRAVDPVAAIRELTHGRGADATLDATGNAEARAQMVRSARVWGRACFVGERGTVTLNPTPDIIHKQLTIFGSWTFSLPLLAEAIRFVVERRVPLGKLITRRYRLDQADEAFREFEAGSVGKSVFVLPSL
jgi:threonine dehydrogenase-like Zn-dependent dehydrogenase